MHRLTLVIDDPATDISNASGIQSRIRVFLPPEASTFATKVKKPAKANVDESLQAAKRIACIGVAEVITPTDHRLIHFLNKLRRRHWRPPLGEVFDPPSDIALRPFAGKDVDTPLVEKVTGRQSQRVLDCLAIEEPLEIQLNYGPSGARETRSISVTMRTPGNDFDLTAGSLMTEGVIRDANDVGQIAYAGDSFNEGTQSPQTMNVLKLGSKQNTVRVDLAAEVAVNLGSLQRNFYTTSSCGICGKASLLALRTFCPPRATNNFQVDAQLLYLLPELLRASQGVFDRTGGLHGAGLFDSAGNLLALREDVGRHNAVDKLIGSEFLADRTPLRDRLLLLSGRASFELLQKALMGGFPIVAAVGAPSSLAVQVAKEFDITLVGFLRESHFNIYHGSERIAGYASTAMGGGE